MLLPGDGMVSCREVHRERERAGSGIELKTSMGNKKKTDTPTWHWGNKKKTDTHRLCFLSQRHQLEVVPLLFKTLLLKNGTSLKLCRYASSEKYENLGIAPQCLQARPCKHVLTRQLVLKSISRAHPSDSDFGPSGLHVWGSYPLAGS